MDRTYWKTHNLSYALSLDFIKRRLISFRHIEQTYLNRDEVIREKDEKLIYNIQIHLSIMTSTSLISVRRHES